MRWEYVLYRKREMGRFGWGGGRGDDNVCIYMTLSRARSRSQIRCLSSPGPFAGLFPNPSLTCPLPFVSLASPSFGASSFMTWHTFIYTYIKLLLWKASLVLVTVWHLFQLRVMQKTSHCMSSKHEVFDTEACTIDEKGREATFNCFLKHHSSGPRHWPGIH